MIFIGVDFGDARVGLAKSDPAGILAGAVGTLKVRGLADAAEQTAEAVARLGGTAVVVGLPRNMDGTEGFRAERTRRFAALVAEKTGAEVVFVDERLSTVEAYTYMNITGLPGRNGRGKSTRFPRRLSFSPTSTRRKTGERKASAAARRRRFLFAAKTASPLSAAAFPDTSRRNAKRVWAESARTLRFRSRTPPCRAAAGDAASSRT